MTVTTNSAGGYVVTMETAASVLNGTAGNTETIPIEMLKVRKSGTTVFQSLAAETPLVMHDQDTPSAVDGDAVSNDFQIEIPFVASDTDRDTLTTSPPHSELDRDRRNSCTTSARGRSPTRRETTTAKKSPGRTAVACVGVLAAVGMAALVAVATPAYGLAPATPVDPGPQLSINLDNGKTSAVDGDKLDYVITIHNLGTDDVAGLLVNQSLPAGLEFGSADSGGAAGADDVNWTLDLKATPDGDLSHLDDGRRHTRRVAAPGFVACARSTADGPPIVCASHSDQLPAGAIAEAKQLAAEVPSRGNGWPPLVVHPGGGRSGRAARRTGRGAAFKATPARPPQWLSRRRLTFGKQHAG